MATYDRNDHILPENEIKLQNGVIEQTLESQ